MLQIKAWSRYHSSGVQSFVAAHCGTSRCPAGAASGYMSVRPKSIRMCSPTAAAPGGRPATPRRCKFRRPSRGNRSPWPT
eukprot:scaffold169137_cov41-Prasinocladus_malaysianus.AAC.1